jgi:hypothetical protein
MPQTSNLGLELVAEGQAQPHVTVNTAIAALDAALGPVRGPSGAFVRLELAELELAGLSGASVTAAALLPDRAIVLGVASWVAEAITGATGYSVGLAGGTGEEFGAALGVAEGASNVGTVGPFAVYADTDVIVTAEGGAFTGGTLRLAAAFLRLGAGA